MTNKSDYYKRQIILPELGPDGQKKLDNAKVLVIGAGGLGSPLLTYLAVSGVGFITVYDDDIIQESNLNRQVLFDPEDIGKNKADVSAKKLSLKNPHINILGISKRFDEHVDISSFDIVVDCTDNFSSKFLAHDLCYRYKKKYCVASIHKFEGQIQFFDFQSTDANTPCLRCLWPTMPSETCVQNCEEAGVIGAIAGVLGTMQAIEIIKNIINLNHLKNTDSLLVNLLELSTLKIKLTKNENCPLCVANQKQIISPDQSLIIDFKQLYKNEYILINLSDNNIAYERILNSNLEDLSLDIKDIDKNKKIAVICKRGITSLKAVKKLKKIGYNNCYSIRDGIYSLNTTE